MNREDIKMLNNLSDDNKRLNLLVEKLRAFNRKINDDLARKTLIMSISTVANVVLISAFIIVVAV